MVLEEHRPTPEEILKKIRMIDPDETRVRQGRLKIFFGYAAGVGKTYAMLEMAHQMKDMGVDVVAGYIEPHIRPATMKLVEGLECLPPLVVSYKGITLREFDLDAALARKPQLILVDELAHSNAQGCRHVKRYQDIEELLRAGIDVYTTVNVQHLESLNDLVSSLTGVTVNGGGCGAGRPDRPARGGQGLPGRPGSASPGPLLFQAEPCRFAGDRSAPDR